MSTPTHLPRDQYLLLRGQLAEATEALGVASRDRHAAAAELGRLASHYWGGGGTDATDARLAELVLELADARQAGKRAARQVIEASIALQVP